LYEIQRAEKLAGSITTNRYCLYNSVPI